MSSVIEQLSGGRVPTRVLCCGHSLGGALATLGTACIAATWQYLFVMVVWSVCCCRTDHCYFPEAQLTFFTCTVLHVGVQSADLKPTSGSGIGWQSAHCSFGALHTNLALQSLPAKVSWLTLSGDDYRCNMGCAAVPTG